MRRTLLLVALVVLVAVVVPSALAQSEEDDEHGDNILYHTGTYEELGVLLKELESTIAKKKAEKSAAEAALEQEDDIEIGVEAKKPQEKKKPVATEQKSASKAASSSDSKPAKKPTTTASTTTDKASSAKSKASPSELGKASHNKPRNEARAPPKDEVEEPKVKVIHTEKPASGSTGSASAKRQGKIKFTHVRRIIQKDESATMYPTLRKENRPTIIHNAPITNQWEAFEKWDFEYFAHRWGTSHAMGPISVSNGTRASGMHETVLVYHNFTEYTAWPGVPKATKEVAMNLGTFFSGQCQKQTEDTWWWMRAMFTLNDTVVESHVQPMDYFINTDAIGNRTAPLASMVTSSMNGKLQLHYETDDMWIVNVHQRQQVLIFSPEDMQKLYLFPWTHPYHRRSQILPLTDASELKYAGIGNVTGFEALLEPREILYIPKFWGYHIINVAPSISVHISSRDAHEKSLGQWDFNKNLIGIAQLPAAKRLTAAKFAIRRVIQPLLDMDTWEQPFPEVEGADPPDTYMMNFENSVLRAFIRKHVQQRYSKLPDYRPRNERDAQSKKELFTEVRDLCRNSRRDGPLEPIEQVRFAPTLDSVVYNLYQHNDLAIRHLQMHDWLDFIAWAAFGDHNKMEAFLMKCF